MYRYAGTYRRCLRSPFSRHVSGRRIYGLYKHALCARCTCTGLKQ